MAKNQRTTLFWIWLMMIVAYFDRVNISIAGPSIQHSLHIGPAKFGYVLSSFAVGYALMQVPGGYLADRIGPRKLLPAALGVWSIFTALTGVARSYGIMVLVRVLFGFGEGLENGAQFKLIGDQFEPRQRSEANSIFLSALAIGPAIATPVGAWLIAAISWRGLFYVSAGMGVVVALLLMRFLPGNRRAVDPQPEPRTDSNAFGGSAVMRNPLVWLVFFTYLSFNMAFWGFVGWIPTFLSQARHIQLAHIGIIASLPYLFGFAGMFLFGYLGATVMFTKRPLMVGACYLAAAAPMYMTFRAGNLSSLIVCLSLAGFFLYGCFGPFWAEAIDLMPETIRGSMSGLVNFGGQIGAIVAPIVIGRIVGGTHSYAGAFLFMSIALLIAGALQIAVQLFPNRAVNSESRAA